MAKCSLINIHLGHQEQDIKSSVEGKENWNTFITFFNPKVHNLKKSACLFQVETLSSDGSTMISLLFQLHYTGILIFTKTGPLFVDLRCC